MIKNITRERKGEIFLSLETLISGFFPIVVILTYEHISPIFSLSISLIFALIFFTSIIIFGNKWHQFREKRAYRDIFLSSLFIMLLFIFFYIGLKFTTPSNAAVILFTQVFFSYIFFRVFKKERLARFHVFGAVLMSLGALMILFPGKIDPNRGDLFVLISAMIAPIANHFQRSARVYVDSEVLLFSRSVISLPFLILIALYFEDVPTFSDISSVFWLLLFNGVLAFGLSKIFWIEAIYRISVTKAAAMAALTPFFTMFFSYILLDSLPSLYQIFGALPIVVGAIFITINKHKTC